MVMKEFPTANNYVDAMPRWSADGKKSVVFFTARGRHTSCSRDWSSDVCSSDLIAGAQPPLAGDQLEPTVGAPGGGGLPHHDRLQQTRLPDRRGKLVERGGIDVAAWLEGVGADVGDGQLDEAALALRFLARGSQQGFEASAETTASRDGFRHAGTSGSGSAAGGAGEAVAADAAVTPPRSTRRMSSCATAR